MKIEAIVRAALLAQEKINRQERLYFKKIYQTLFVNEMKNKAASWKFIDINTLSRDCKFLANVFFENAHAAANNEARLAKSFFCADGRVRKYPSDEFLASGSEEKRVFQLRLVEFIEQVLENEWILLSKLRIACIWQNASYTSNFSIDNYDKKYLKEVLLDRARDKILWEPLCEELGVLVQLSRDFFFYQDLSDKGSASVIVGSVIMLISLLFVSTPIPVILSIFSLGLFFF